MNKTDAGWLDEVSGVGCIVCRVHMDRQSPALIHHIRTWHGKRVPRRHDLVIPLCFLHHDAKIPGVSFHSDTEAWCRRFGSQEELLLKTHQELIKHWEKRVVPGLETLVKKYKAYLELSGVEVPVVDGTAIFTDRGNDYSRDRG